MAFFNLSFLVHGTPQLAKLRGVLQGIGQQSYKTFDALARSMSTLDKATGRTLSRLAMFAGGGGLAYGAMKTVNYSLYQSNSMITTNRIMLEELVGTAKAAKGYIKVVQDLSGSFGTDMSEMMNASRGLIQMFTQIGSRGNQPATPAHLDKMLKLVTAVSLLDTENRGLAYTAFAFKEGLQGVGQGDWRSMKNRLEINLGKENEKKITAAVKAGNMDDVVRLFEEAFKKIGINADSMIKRIMGEGLTQNVTRLATYFSRSFQLIGEHSYLALAKPFARLNTFIAKQFDMGDDNGKKPALLMRLLGDTSESLNQQFITPFRIAMDKFTESFKVHMTAVVIGVKALVGGVFDLFTGLATPFIAFAKGLFGITTSLDKGDDVLRGFGETAEQIGKKLSKIGLFFRELADSANGFALAINGVVKAFIKLSSALPPALVGAMFGGIKGGIVGAGAGAIAGGYVSSARESDMVMIDGKMQPNPDKGGMGVGEIFNTALMGLFGITAIKSLFGGNRANRNAGGEKSGSRVSSKVFGNNSELTSKQQAKNQSGINSRSGAQSQWTPLTGSSKESARTAQYYSIRQNMDAEAIRKFQNYETTWVDKTKNLAPNPNMVKEGLGTKFMNKMNSPVTGAGLNTLFLGSFFAGPLKSIWTAVTTFSKFGLVAGTLTPALLLLAAPLAGFAYALYHINGVLNAKADELENAEIIRQEKDAQGKLAKIDKDTSGLLGGVGLGTYNMAWKRDKITQLVTNPEQLLASMLYVQKHGTKAESAAYNERMDRLYNYRLKNPQGFTNEEGSATGGNAWGSVATKDKWGNTAKSPSEQLREITVNVKGADKGLADLYRKYFEELLIKANPELRKNSTKLTAREISERDAMIENAVKLGLSQYPNSTINPEKPAQ